MKPENWEMQGKTYIEGSTTNQVSHDLKSAETVLVYSGSYTTGPATGTF